MTEAWRNHYDSWKLASGLTEYSDVDEDGEPIGRVRHALSRRLPPDPQAGRGREDAMFDAPEREEWIPYVRD